MAKTTTQQPHELEQEQKQPAEKKQLTLEELEQVVGAGLAIKIHGHKDWDSETALVEI